MQLPPDVAFHPSHRLFVWKPRGSLNEEAVNKILSSVAEQEAASKEPFLRFVDLSALDLVELNFKYVFHVSLYRRLTYADQAPTRSAFLVTSPEASHYSKLHQILTDYSPLDVTVFDDREAAAKWLRVRREMLDIR